MGLIIFLAIFYLLGCIFEEKDKPSKLPPFTKEEAERYYDENFKNK